MKPEGRLAKLEPDHLLKLRKMIAGTSVERVRISLKISEVTIDKLIAEQGVRTDTRDRIAALLG